jgi:hypothetical protein
MLEIWGLGCLLVILFFFFKEGAKKAPLGCLTVVLFVLFIFIKSCVKLQEEEREKVEYSKKRMDNLLKELGHDPDSVRLQWLKDKYGSDYVNHMEEL